MVTINCLKACSWQEQKVQYKDDYGNRNEFRVRASFPNTDFALGSSWSCGFTEAAWVKSYYSIDNRQLTFFLPSTFLSKFRPDLRAVHTKGDNYNSKVLLIILNL